MNGEVETTARGPMDIRRVMAALPHRYPMLLIDRVVSLVPSQSIHAIKAVSVNEPFFQGHFPTRPIMPGVLIVEATKHTDRDTGIDVGAVREISNYWEAVRHQYTAFEAGLTNSSSSWTEDAKTWLPVNGRSSTQKAGTANKRSL